jgi:hypothetical protein
VLIIISLVLYKWVYPSFHLTPYSWGSDYIHKKRLAILKENEKPNVLFLGASTTLRQVDPLVFDSIIHASHAGFKSYSFNMGANWMASSELFHIYHGLTETDSLRPQYVFIELQKIKMPDYANFFTTRIKYWYTVNNFLFTVKAAWNSSFSFAYKMAIMLKHAVNYTGALLNLGYVTEALHFKTKLDNLNEPEKFLGPELRGYIGLSKEEMLRDNPGIRFKTRQLDTLLVYRRKLISEKAFNEFEKNEKNYHLNSYYLNYLNRLIEESEKKKIKLIFYLNPRMDRAHYAEVLPIFNALPANHKINLSDARQYPEFYIAENSFDITHLNKKGAALYTAALAQNFLRLKDMK